VRAANPDRAMPELDTPADPADLALRHARLKAEFRPRGPRALATVARLAAVTCRQDEARGREADLLDTLDDVTASPDRHRTAERELARIVAHREQLMRELEECIRALATTRRRGPRPAPAVRPDPAAVQARRSTASMPA